MRAAWGRGMGPPSGARLGNDAWQSRGTHRKQRVCDKALTGPEQGTGPIYITCILSSASLPYSSPVRIMTVSSILLLADFDFQDRSFKRSLYILYATVTGRPVSLGTFRNCQNQDAGDPALCLG